MMKKENMLVSFSGGETSGFMCNWILLNLSEKYNLVFVYANTGEENEETLEFVNKCDLLFGLNLIWVEAVVDPNPGKGIRHKIVDFETASRKGQPFYDIIEKYGMPNRTSPFCSDYLKALPIHSYMKSLGWGRSDYLTAIGIRSDEMDRVSSKRVKKRLYYPLVEEAYITKQHVNFFWSKMPFRLLLKGYEGNCKTCWKKSFRKLATIAKHTPEKFEVFAALEKKYENYIPLSRQNNPEFKPPVRFFRGNKTVKEIFEIYKAPRFEDAKDDSTDIDYQISLLNDGTELDQVNGCEESCEAFG